MNCHQEYEVGESHLYLNFLCVVMYLGYRKLHVPEIQNLTNAVFYAAPGTPYVHPGTSLPNLYFLVWLTTTYRISLIRPPCLPSSCSSIYCLDICRDGQGCSLFVTQMCEPRAIWRRWLCCLQQPFPLYSCTLFPILRSSSSPPPTWGTWTAGAIPADFKFYTTEVDLSYFRDLYATFRLPLPQPQCELAVFLF